MSNRSVDPLILHAWLAARSVARRLPAAVPEYGGFRVDTKSDAEVARWVFPETGTGLQRLARSISEPRHLVKLCGTADRLLATLPIGWQLHAPGYFMQAAGDPATIEARIFTEQGALAASGYATQAFGVLVYDRIVTEAGHRRKGLGHVLMRTLRDAAPNPRSKELLVATEDGRPLYATLGWEVISPYSTASIPPP